MNNYRNSQTGELLTLHDAVLRDNHTGSITLPVKFTTLPKAVIDNLPGMSVDEIAYVVLSMFMSNDVPHATLNRIIKSTYSSHLHLDTIKEEILFKVANDKNATDILTIYSQFLIGISNYLSPTRKLKYVIADETDFTSHFKAIATESGNCVIALHIDDRHEVYNIADNRQRIKNLYDIAIAGTPSLRRTTLVDLVHDNKFANAANLMLIRDVNPGAYLPFAVIFFSLAAQVMRHSPKTERLTVIMDHYDDLFVMAAATAMAMGLKITVKFRNQADGQSQLPAPLITALKMMKVTQSEWYINAEEERSIIDSASSAAPVIEFETKGSLYADTPELRSHKPVAIVRNLLSLKNTIESIH